MSAEAQEVRGWHPRLVGIYRSRSDLGEEVCLGCSSAPPMNGHSRCESCLDDDADAEIARLAAAVRPMPRTRAALDAYGLLAS